MNSVRIHALVRIRDGVILSLDDRLGADLALRQVKETYLLGQAPVDRGWMLVRTCCQLVGDRDESNEPFLSSDFQIGLKLLRIQVIPAGFHLYERLPFHGTRLIRISPSGWAVLGSTENEGDFDERLDVVTQKCGAPSGSSTASNADVPASLLLVRSPTSRNGNQPRGLPLFVRHGPFLRRS